jgi:hypothetical protein
VNRSDPTEVALAVAGVLTQAKLRHALYGGLLLAAYGDARETLDVDLAVIGVTATQASAALTAAGMSCQVEIDGMLLGGIRLSRIALLGTPVEPGMMAVDLVEPRNTSYGERALARAPLATVRGREIRVLTPEDFLVFKVLSTRERDLQDAASVVRRSGARLDQAQVEADLAELGRALPDHAVDRRWREVLARSTSTEP